jgi:hypothetical protein
LGVRRVELVLVVALVIGCSSAKPIPQPIAPAPKPESHASVTAKLIADPNAPTVTLPPGEVYVQPQVMHGNPMPQYPAELIPLKLAQHVVVVRITSNEQSRVEDVQPSPLGGSTDDQFRGAFETAVTEAVTRWKVYPAEIRKMKRGPDTDNDGKPDYDIVMARKLLKAFFDIAFRFEIVDGKPVVRTDAPQGATVQ